MSGKNFNFYRKFVLGADDNIPLFDGTSVTGINFDNAATTPPLYSVIKDTLKFSNYYSSIHRGEGYKSRLSTMLYDKSRIDVGNFVNFDKDKMDVIFVKNCTEAINKLSNILFRGNHNDVILSTFMEHHSNDLPWRGKYIVDYVQIDNKGNLILEDLEDKLKKYNGNVRLVTVTGASNVTGQKNNVHLIAKLAHKYNAKILVDGAQLIPHSPLDLKPYYSNEHIDFVAFSAHKMYAPFGCGVLIGPKNFFESVNPDYVGGGTIDFVMHGFVKWTKSPEKHEAGTPNVLGAVALSSAIKTLTAFGMDDIESYERLLTEYLTRNLLLIPKVILYGDYLNCNNKVSIVSFNIEGVRHNTLAKILSLEFGIAVRSGCFCAQPYMQKLLKITREESVSYINRPKETYPGTVRVSLGMYNTINEIDRFLYAVSAVSKNTEYYLKKYQNTNNILY